ncbi:MAG TPA: molybdopterin-synthase adenylyltransferase MoeB [Trueperaceae bacterium]|nr:molybdopterin-synthase adenylyltransferase MoeB [Trueperaceae bacterium]
MFTRSQLERYSRQIVMSEVGADGQRRLSDASVLVVGAGGLGSPALLYLAGAGIGRLGVIDSDAVDLSNLHRQILHTTADVGRQKVASARERLAALNPDVVVEEHGLRLDSHNALELIGRFDMVLDGSDNFPTRYLVNDACVIAGKPLVYGALSRFEGQVGVLATGSAPCYRCLFPTPPPPGTVPSCAEAGVLGVLTGVVGSLMATEALRLALGGFGVDGSSTGLADSLMLVDLLTPSFTAIDVSRDPDCPVCGDRPTITELIDYQAFCGLG